MQSNYTNVNVSIGVPGVTSSVRSFADLVKALDRVHFAQVSGLFEITKQVINLNGFAELAGWDSEGTEFRPKVVVLRDPWDYLCSGDD